MQPTVRRWETKTRYFEVWVYTDLLGDKILAAANGGMGTRLGMVRILAVGEDSIAEQLAQVEKRRLRHGYLECAGIAAGRACPPVHRSQDRRIADAAQRIGNHQLLDPRRKLRGRVVEDQVVVDAGTFGQVQDGRFAIQVR